MLSARLDDLSRLLIERARADLPEWLVERPELRGPIRTITRESIRVELAAMCEGGRLPNECPAIDAEWARLAARVGGSVSGLVDGYRRGHQVQWEGWFALVDREEGDPDVRRRLLERGSRFFFDYAGRLGRLTTDEYIRERDRLLGGREQRRMHLVRELLDGRDVDASALDYRLDSWHVGVIAWGPHGADALPELAHSLDRRLFQVEAIEGTWWGWLGADRPLSTAAESQLRRHRPTAGTNLAMGTEAQGLAGFRSTHKEALGARRGARGKPGPLTHYDDVALEVLAAHDSSAARLFVARELRGLDGDDARAGRLRETLDAYFRAGHNAAATAAGLGVHEQTVAARLRAVEERTGHAVAQRRAELEVALRLRRLLRSADDSPTG